MKLIDLLVQELPKRGGWPKGANFAVQDADGTVKFAKTLTHLHYLAGEWRSNENGYDWIHGDRPFDGNFVTEWTADDNYRAVISMARYEREISKNKTGKQPANEWNGEGLPPVGCECEYQYKVHGSEWCRFECVAVDGKAVFGWSNNTPIALQSNTHNFRPLRTEADKKRDAAVEKIKELLMFDYGDDPRINDATFIYDAIAAGEIPGVKLDD